MTEHVRTIAVSRLNSPADRLSPEEIAALRSIVAQMMMD